MHLSLDYSQQCSEEHSRELSKKTFESIDTSSMHKDATACTIDLQGLAVGQQGVSMGEQMTYNDLLLLAWVLMADIHYGADPC